MNGQMPPGAPPWAQSLPVVISLLVMAALMARRMRPRPLNVNRLWISPSFITLGLGALMVRQPPPTDPLSMAIFALLLALGGALGWYRGRSTLITVDPASHQVSAQVSPFGMVLLLVIFAIRQLGGPYLRQHAGEWHIDPALITDGSVFLAWGLVTVQRGEMRIRAQRLVEEAKTAPAAAAAPVETPAEGVTVPTPAPNPPIVQ